MRIFVEPGSYSLQNVGDTAMLQASIRRLREVWPDARVAVVTGYPARLLQLCPGVEPVLAPQDRTPLSEPALLGRAYRFLPGTLARRLRACESRLAASHPSALLTGLRLTSRLKRVDEAALQQFVAHVATADLVVASGAGGLNDAFAWRASTLLATLDLAARRGVPTAMFSQGIGPLRQGPFRRRVAATLRNVGLIALRERVSGPPLLADMGIDPSRVMVTGDDAIELAYEARSDTPGDGLGINLRAAAYAGAGDAMVAAVRPLLHQAANRLGTGLVAIPISHRQNGLDARTNRALLGDAASDGGLALDTPDKVIRQVGRCRLVVTGSYHAAVFALAQGIPAVALVNSAYYADKFRGLDDMFGGGCESVRLDDPSLSDRLPEAIARGWHGAAVARERLLAAASRQIALSRQAYAQLSSPCGAGAGAVNIQMNQVAVHDAVNS